MTRPVPWLIACLIAGELLTVVPSAAGQIFGRRQRSGGTQAAVAPEVTVKVDRRVISMDEELTVELRLSGDFDRYEEPDFTGFNVESRGSSQQIQLVNGRMSHEKVMTFLLVPRAAGRFTIGSARAFNNGRAIASSKPITIRVKAVAPLSSTTAQAARDVTSAAAQNSVFIQVDTKRTSYYVGEPFLLTWRLFYRRDVGVQSLESVSDPRLEGLLAEEILGRDHKPRPKEKRIGGQRFRFFDHSMRLATGLAPGKVTIDSVTVRYIAGSLFRQTRHSVRSKPFELQIKPLPTDGRPESFREGNIGRFMFKASLRNADGVEPKHVQTGERLIMDVVVSGKGGLVSVKSPVIAASDTFDVEQMPGNSDDAIRKDADGMNGRRVFQYIVSATKPGVATTPEVQFAFFDPEFQAYHTHRWPGVSLEVEGRAVGSTQDGDVLSSDDIRPNVQSRALSDHVPLDPLRALWFWLLFAMPFAAVVVVELRHRLRTVREANPEKRRGRGAHRKARTRLALAESAAKEGLVRDFYGQLSRCVEGYLEDRANIPAQGMTQDELRAACGEAGYEDGVVQRLIDELDNCDFARFAPVPDVDASMKEASRRVSELLDALDNVTPERRA